MRSAEGHWGLRPEGWPGRNQSRFHPRLTLQGPSKQDDPENRATYNITPNPVYDTHKDSGKLQANFAL